MEGYLAELRGFRRYDQDRFLTEPAIHRLAEPYARTHRAIQEDLGDLERFASAMAELL